MEKRVRVGRHTVSVKWSLFDRVVEAVAPTWALRNLWGRTMLALSGSSYVGASRERRSLKEWKTLGGSADADTLGDLEILRNRSRDLVRNAPIACGAVSAAVTNVVGTGLRLQPAIDRYVLGMSEDEADEWESRVEREWRLWAESTECDAARTLTFAGLQELAFRQVLENGDVFVVLPRIKRPGTPYSLKVQMVEADRVCNKDWASDSERLAGGVQKDEAGAPVAYHILQQHPGEVWSGRKRGTWQVVSAFGEKTGLRNVLHLYRVLRPGQSRGVPYLAPVIESLKQLDRYTEAELMAAVVSGMFTVFIKTETGDAVLNPMQPTAEVGGSTSDEDYKLGAGAIVGLGPNESIETANPTRPSNAFDPFVEAILRQVGVALEIPFEVLIKHFTASYSAARAALLEAWRFFSARRQWLVTAFCQPVFEAWLYEAVALGRVSAPGYFADPLIAKAYAGARWIGPSPGQIDPVKEVQAAEKRLELGLSTRTEETAALTGGDFERNVKQIAKERAMMREAGILVERAERATVADDEPDDEGDFEGR